MSDLTLLFNQLNLKPVNYNKIYTIITGSLTSGVLLSQLIYWSGTRKLGEEEFFKVDAELMNETGLTKDELVLAKKRLSPFVIITKKGLPAKSHYFIDSEVLINAIISYGEKQSLDNGKSIDKTTGKAVTRQREKHKHIYAENTTENTTENTNQQFSTENLPVTNNLNFLTPLDTQPKEIINTIPKPNNNISFSFSSFYSSNIQANKINKANQYLTETQKQFLNWFNNRSKSTRTEGAFNLNLKKIMQYDNPALQIEVIEKATASGWRGLQDLYDSDIKKVLAKQKFTPTSNPTTKNDTLIDLF